MKHLKRCKVTLNLFLPSDLSAFDLKELLFVKLGKWSNVRFDNYLKTYKTLAEPFLYMKLAIKKFSYLKTYHEKWSAFVDKMWIIIVLTTDSTKGTSFCVK